jgi:hypothetical protein
MPQFMRTEITGRCGSLGAQGAQTAAAASGAAMSILARSREHVGNPRCFGLLAEIGDQNSLQWILVGAKSS